MYTYEQRMKAAKNRRIRREMKVGRLKCEKLYLTIQYFYKEKDMSIRRMYSRLGVTKASYYKWLHREVPAAETETGQLAELVQEYHGQFCHILCYRRMNDRINKLNHKCYNIKRIH